jgi:hypothetical protein
MKTKLETNERRMIHNIQFEQGCMLVTDTTDYNGTVCPKLYIQVIDAYGYQRELSLAYMRVPGRGDEGYRWEIYSYKHPGIRNISELNTLTATAMIVRLVELATKYPSLLFNEGTPRQARHNGFVRFHDLLLRGIIPLVEMIA